MPSRRRGTIRTHRPTCEACGQVIAFVKMVATGKRVPIDPFPVADGNVCARAIGQSLHGYVISAQRGPSPAFTRYAAHFGTCPDRERPEPKPTEPPAPTLFDSPEGNTAP
jgi:hypothetical protein